MNPRIHYTRPSITALEIEYATDAAANGWGDRCYDYIVRFEEAFKAHLGVQYAIATSSCTGALHMGMAALGIGPGDKVILADTNWIASAAPIVCTAVSASATANIRSGEEIVLCSTAPLRRGLVRAYLSRPPCSAVTSSMPTFYA